MAKADLVKVSMAVPLAFLESITPHSFEVFGVEATQVLGIALL